MHNRELLFQELNKAMNSNPDFSILEMIDYVLQQYMPYKDKFYIEDKPYKPVPAEQILLRRSNSEILKALQIFNGRK